MARGELGERIDARVDEMVASEAADEAGARQRRELRGRRERRSASSSLLHGRSARNEARAPSVRPPPAHLDAADGGGHADRPHGDGTTMEWQRVIDCSIRRTGDTESGPQARNSEVREMDRARQRLPDRRGRRAALGTPTPERIKRLCDPHFGVGSDGLLLLAPVEDPAYVAELRIFNPDGSEAELSGNGARQAVLYLRRSGWTDADEFTILTKAGPITPTIRSDREATLEMGRASTASDDFPSGAEDGRGELEAAGGPGASSTSRSATRSARSRRAMSSSRSISRHRPGDREQPALPQPDQRELLSGRRRPRPGPDLRAWGGGDARLRDRRHGSGGGGPPGRGAGEAHRRARWRRARRSRSATTCACA